jgi:hypothetical protein
MHSPRLAISYGLTALVAIIIVGAAAGIYFLSNSSPFVLTSSATSSTMSSSIQSSTSVTLTHITSSQASTHMTSSHTGTVTTTATSASSASQTSVSRIGNEPTQEFVFGEESAQNDTTQVIPANTMVWTTWTINSTVQVNAAETGILVTPQSVNSTITAATYINGKLDDYESYSVTPSTEPTNKTQYVDQLVTVYAPFKNQTIPAGSVVSLVFLTPVQVTAYLSNGSIGHHTNEASLIVGSIPPAQLPSPTSTVSHTLNMYAYYLQE